MKPFWQSKAKLAAIVTGVLAAYTGIGGVFGLPPVPDWAYALLGAIGLYGVRQAIDK